VRTKILVLLAVLAMAFAVIPVASAADGPALDPASVEAVVFPGASHGVEKTVHTPELPPKLDVCVVIDLSGSYGDDLPNIKAVAPQVWDDIVAGGVSDLQMALTSFVDFPFPGWGSAASGDYAYRLDQQLTPIKATWVAAIDAMSVKFGGDGPESQYEAFYQLATGAGNGVQAPGTIAADQQCDFRDDATKVAIMTTDAPFHNAGDGGGPFPYPGHSAVDTTNALVAGEIVVIGLKAPGAGGELDALAAATGGSTIPTSGDSSDIAEAILAALKAIEVDVSMTSDCEWPISTTFAPDSITVTSGEDAVFAETISVAADAPGGTYTCVDWALIDGDPMVDDAGAIIYETKTIHVPEGFLTGGGQVGKGKTALAGGGNVGFLADFSVVGQWQFRDQGLKLNMHSLTIDTLQFSNDAGAEPDPPAANANVGNFTGTARVKVGTGEWDDTCTFQAEVHDHSEPNVADQFGIEIQCAVAGNHSYPVASQDQGNFQIHSGVKD
jgi:hypothetical protein